MFLRFLRQPNKPIAPSSAGEQRGKWQAAELRDGVEVTVTSSRANALGMSKALNNSVSVPVAVTSNVTSSYKGIVVPGMVPVDGIFVSLHSTVPSKSASSSFEFGGVGFRSSVAREIEADAEGLSSDIRKALTNG